MLGCLRYSFQDLYGGCALNRYMCIKYNSKNTLHPKYFDEVASKFTGTYENPTAWSNAPVFYGVLIIDTESDYTKGLCLWALILSISMFNGLLTT